MKALSPTMVKALRLASKTGALRRLPGGYWVASDHPPVNVGQGMIATLSDRDCWVGTQTVMSCQDRGVLKCSWERRYELAALTDAGRGVLISYGDAA